MRFPLSRKILLVYGLFLSFSLIQGVLLYSVIDQFRSHDMLNGLVREFKFEVHTLEELKDTINLNIDHAHDEPIQNQDLNSIDHEPFDDQFRKTQNILTQLTNTEHTQLAVYISELQDAQSYLSNFRTAYFELHELIHNSFQLHEREKKIFSRLREIFPALEPELRNKLFFLVLDHFSLESDIAQNLDITLLPQLKILHQEISRLTSDTSTLSLVRNVTDLTEAYYLNALAINDRETFLEDSAEHLTVFCDQIATSLTKNINRYQDRLKLTMGIMVAAAVVLTGFLFWLSRQYFNRFLISQQKAITAIEKGNFDYQLAEQPQDELGDLAVFMKSMAGSLQESREKIRQNEENIRLILDSAAEGIYGLDPQGKCTFCNNSFLQLLGYDKEEELIGKSLHDLVHHTKNDGADYPWDECIAHRGFLEGKQTHSENEMYFRRDGSSFYAECWSHPIIHDNEVTGAVVTILDISDRRKALKALHNSEELYRTLVENIDLGITLIDKDHTIVMTNSAQAKSFERNALSFKGHKCFRTFKNQGQICSDCPGIIAMETGKVHETLAESANNDGSHSITRIKTFPVFTENDEAYGFIEVVEDVTEKMQAEQKLAAEKEQLSVTLRSIGDGVITTDVKGCVVLINKVAEDLCGWSQSEARGKKLTEIFHIVNAITGEECENPVDKILTTGQVATLDSHTALIARDGTRRSIADSGAAIRDQNSEVIGVVLVFRDVTEENRKENELLKAKKLESLGVLAGGIAHDFNNILSAILGNINLVRHIVNPDEKKAHLFLEEAEKASIRAQNLTHQLLTFSKGGEPVRKAASIADIITDSTTFVLRGTNINCTYDIPDGLWAVDVDPGQISQVVQNIILNARHAMPQVGTIHISCSNVLPEEKDRPLVLQKNKKFVRVDIADNGIGIPAKVIDNIFDPYFTTKKEGSGLGLSICLSIINKHHGYISALANEEEGTVFTFYLPASDDTVIEDKPAHHEEVYAKENLTVLIMDDDEQIRSIVAAMLLHLGCTTLQADDGETAVRLYASSMKSGKPIDLVIMDLTIPGGMGGKEAVAEILKLDTDARVIVSSGYSNDPIMAKHAEYGFRAAIVKPYQLGELAQSINTALAGK